MLPEKVRAATLALEEAVKEVARAERALGDAEDKQLQARHALTQAIAEMK